MTRYCLGFIRQAGEVLLILKNRPDWQRGRLNGVGGKLEAQESPLDAMCRETREETGLDIPPERWRHVCTLLGEEDPEQRAAWEVTVFTVVATTPEITGWRSLTDESLQLVLEDALPPHARGNLEWLLAMCRDPEIWNRPLTIHYPR